MESTRLRTAGEVIKEAGLDWKVETQPIYITLPDRNTPTGEAPDFVVKPEFNAIVRQDNLDVFGVVKGRWQAIQNTEAFGFADALVGINQGVYEQAGAFRGGKRVWLQIRLPGEIEIATNREDTIKKYLLLSNSHDGKEALKAVITPIRVSCENSLTNALRSAREGISIRHTGDLNSKVSEAQRILGLTIRYYDDLSEAFNTLATKNVTRAQVKDFVEQLVPNNKEAEKNTRAQNVRNEIVRLFEHGKGNDLPGIRGTAWALVNGVTEYTTHHRTARGENMVERKLNRLDSVWFGSGAELNARAFDLVQELVK